MMRLILLWLAIGFVGEQIKNSFGFEGLIIYLPLVIIAIVFLMAIVEYVYRLLSIRFLNKKK